ncbi:MAG TPA: hypothetical protein VF803_02565 [Candidatus Paceibacterota bacterium]
MMARANIFACLIYEAAVVALALAAGRHAHFRFEWWVAFTVLPLAIFLISWCIPAFVTGTFMALIASAPAYQMLAMNYRRRQLSEQRRTYK